MSDANAPVKNEHPLRPKVPAPFVWKNTRTTNGDAAKSISVKGMISGSARPRGDVGVVVAISRAGKELGVLDLWLPKASSVRSEVTDQPQQLFEFRIEPLDGGDPNRLDFKVLNYKTDGRSGDTDHHVDNIGDTSKDIIVSIKEVRFDNIDQAATQAVEATEEKPAQKATPEEYSRISYQSGAGRGLAESLTVDGVEQFPQPVKAGEQDGLGRSLTE